MHHEAMLGVARRSQPLAKKLYNMWNVRHHSQLEVQGQCINIKLARRPGSAAF